MQTKTKKTMGYRVWNSLDGRYAAYNSANSHILSSSTFTKNVEQCTQIGNYLIDNKIPGYNTLNYDGWAPIHIAAKYSSYIAFEWIGYINKILESQK